MFYNKLRLACRKKVTRQNKSSMQEHTKKPAYGHKKAGNYPGFCPPIPFTCSMGRFLQKGSLDCVSTALNIQVQEFALTAISFSLVCFRL